MASIVFEKDPITLQDLELGYGQINQERNGIIYQLDKVELIRVINNVSELADLDFNKFRVAMLFDVGDLSFFFWNQNLDTNLADNINYFESNNSTIGLWERKNFYIGSKNFVQVIENTLVPCTTQQTSYILNPNIQGNWNPLNQTNYSSPVLSGNWSVL